MNHKVSPLILWPGERHEMIFRWIPPGRFRMGSRGFEKNEEPRHWVEITQGFWMGETSVTRVQYCYLSQWAERMAMFDEYERSEASQFDGMPNCAVNDVSWYKALARIFHQKNRVVVKSH